MCVCLRIHDVSACVFCVFVCQLCFLRTYVRVYVCCACVCYAYYVFCARVVSTSISAPRVPLANPFTPARRRLHDRPSS